MCEMSDKLIFDSGIVYEDSPSISLLVKSVTVGRRSPAIESDADEALWTSI